MSTLKLDSNNPFTDTMTTSTQHPGCFISMFTCTYNRAETLDRVFESLKNQTFRDFEWIVFDNGSTDNTQAVLQKMTVEADFPIKLMHWPDNTGIQNAFNRGIEVANGEFWLLMDSDDACIPTALEQFHTIWQSIPEQARSGFAGVTVNCEDQHGQLVGKEFPKSPIDSTYTEMMYRYRNTGEKWGFNKTSVLREFPFPNVPDHINAGVIWRKIGNKYLTRFVNERLRIYYINEEGREDQLTHHHAVSSHTAVSRRVNSQMALNEDMRYFFNAPHLLFKKAIVYVWFSEYLDIGLKQSVKEVNSWGAQLLTLLAYPAGRLAHWYTQR